MEEGNNKADLHGNAVRQFAVQTSGNPKSTLSGRSSPKSSPPYRRWHSNRTPRRESNLNSGTSHWFRNNRVLLWLMLITIWAYIGFHVQSKWAHGDHRKEELFGYKSEAGSSGNLQNTVKAENTTTAHGDQWKEELISHKTKAHSSDNLQNTVKAKNTTTAHDDQRKEELIGYKTKTNSSDKLQRITEAEKTTTFSAKDPAILEGKRLISMELNGSSVKKVTEVSSKQNTIKKHSRRSERRLRGASSRLKRTTVENRTGAMEEGMIPKRNTSYGFIVGPFGSTEDHILGWSADKRQGTCDRMSKFANTISSRSFLLIFHELSMTGAPLSMMELATELLSCGGSVSAVVLSMKGGLISELDRRGIRVLKDRAQLSFKTAKKADLIIAGSAVCSSWIEQYLVHFPAGARQIVWWIMENRREYFERSKNMLRRVKMLTFLSELQSKLWLSWCEEERIQLNMQPMIVPLSVNDELAFVAGIRSSLNTLAFSPENMLERRNRLRAAVRNEMGMGDNDMLVMSLSSINPTKGQRLLLESVLLVAEQNVSMFERNETRVEKLLNFSYENATIVTAEVNSSSSSRPINQDSVQQVNITSGSSRKRRKHSKLRNTVSSDDHNSKSMTTGHHQERRNLLSVSKDQVEQGLKVLIGSLGSKSNKVLYVKAMLRFLSQHSNLTKLALWTPTTTRVASLYAAADVYVINAQGLGETFGRVTVEAMAFGLPVLGTDAGGTREIVEHNATGLLHPIGRQGIQVLAQNIQYLLSNPTARDKMGKLGRKKVQEKYLKKHMYEEFAKVLLKCLKIK